MRLRTKYLLSLLVVSSIVTWATLWVVGRSVRVQLRKQIGDDLSNSVVVFRDFQNQREIGLASSAELLAGLPGLKALMTTRDAVTIQDASAYIWHSAPSDLFVLANPEGTVLALHTSIPGMTRSIAQDLLHGSLQKDQPSYWWYGAGHLYQVFLQPIYFGKPSEGSALGVLGVGHEISETLARQVSRIASSQVAFFYGNTLITSTLHAEQSPELINFISNPSATDAPGPTDVRLGEETFAASTVRLAPDAPPYVRLSVLKSYENASLFLSDLNRLLLALGLLAVAGGSAAVFLISITFTKPLANLVAGVRALATGDFSYPLTIRGSDEISELTGAFDRMRTSLQRTQQELLAAERLATIGRTASSISHDLRHPLTAVVANAEFLCEEDLTPLQREELYREIRMAVEQLTDLIDSLLEFSQARESLRRVFGGVEKTVERAVHTVRARSEYQRVSISVIREGRCETWFDQKKVERAIVNLLLNACEFAPPQAGRVEVNLRESKDQIEIRVVDNGPGVPMPIRDKLFEPFVSYGKQNGVGLGLAIGQKIFQDHGGDACLESTEHGKTVFRLTLPIIVSTEGIPV
jgi:signal transduction histidine kinase